MNWTQLCGNFNMSRNSTTTNKRLKNCATTENRILHVRPFRGALNNIPNHKANAGDITFYTYFHQMNIHFAIPSINFLEITTQNEICSKDESYCFWKLQLTLYSTILNSWKSPLIYLQLVIDQCVWNVPYNLLLNSKLALFFRATHKLILFLSSDEFAIKFMNVLDFSL